MVKKRKNKEKIMKNCRKPFFLISLLMLLIFASCGSETKNKSNMVRAGASGTVINDYSSVVSAQSCKDTEGMRFISRMTVGINLGNQFDANNCSWVSNELDYEFAWSKAKTTDAYIDAVFNAGFNTIRIPVSWHDHVDGNYKISEAWLNRVSEVVKYCYDKGMFVILDIHHDVSQDYYYPTDAKYNQSAKYMTAIWKQLCEKFSDYGERLIFESINEPRLTGSGIEWWVSDIEGQWGEAIKNIVKLNQVFVDTVRASGGNNATRYLMVPSYADAPDPTVTKSFTLPNDAANHIIVTVHSYSPYDFAQNVWGGSTTSFNDSAKSENLRQLKLLYEKYVKNGIPVLIGEFGCVDKNNDQDFTNYVSYMVGVSKQYGMRAVIWDNNAFNTSGATSGGDAQDTFGLINRSTCQIVKPNAIDAMMQYYADMPGHTIKLDDKTAGGAVFEGIENNMTANGSVSFKLKSSVPCIVLSSDGATENYSRLKAAKTSEENCYEFTVDVTDDVTITVCFLGDVDLDGSVDSADALKVLRFDVGNADFNALQLLLADVTKDGKTDSADALQILRFDVGKPSLEW